MGLHYNPEFICLLTETKLLDLKPAIKVLTFQLNFFSEVGISNGFNATESREVSSNRCVHVISVDFNSIDKSEVLNIHPFLLEKILYYWVLVALKQQRFCHQRNKHAWLDLLLLISNNFDPKYYPLMISLDKCNGSCNVISPKICIQKKNKTQMLKHLIR